MALVLALGLGCRPKEHSPASAGAERAALRTRRVDSSPASPTPVLRSSELNRDVARSTGDSIRLLFVGTYDRGLAPVATSQGWYGLFHSSGGWDLTSVQVVLDSTRTPCSPSDTEALPYPRITIARSEARLSFLSIFPACTQAASAAFSSNRLLNTPGRSPGPTNLVGVCGSSCHTVRPLTSPLAWVS